MTARLEAIVFNHDPLSPANGINLRRDAWETVPIPEWRLAAGSDADDSVAAYAVSEARRAAPTILAQLRRTNPAVTAIQVRAVDPAGNANVLGALRPRTVAFRADGTSGFETFELDGSRLTQAGVGRHLVRWRWQLRGDPHQPWSDFAETAHTVYTILAPPWAPWQQTPFGPANTQLPWTAVLDHACRWAASAQTPDAAATRITQAVFDLGPEIVEYGCPIGGATQYSVPYFQCSAFLERLRGGFGRGPFVNCTDCATIVSTFANILGCRLWQSTMRGDAPFALNAIIAIGSTRWRTACDWGFFNYHEVAWQGACTQDDAVFDACLLVDGDADPTSAPRTPLLPAALRFGRTGDGVYRDRLAAPSGRPQCRPQPTTRQLRFII